MPTQLQFKFHANHEPPSADERDHITVVASSHLQLSAVTLAGVATVYAPADYRPGRQKERPVCPAWNLDL